MTFRAWAPVPLLLALSVAPANARPGDAEIVSQATAVLQQIMAIPASAIPEQLLAKAQAVAIFPGVKGGAFVVGIRKGHGVLVARDEQGQWRAPQFLELTGGSVGWQAGIQSTDVVLVFRSRESLVNLMKGKLTIGAEASAAAGPVGRQASAATDMKLQSEIYSYSRSRGAFLGVSLDGTMLAPDHQADARFYQPAAPGLPAPPAPPAAQQLVALVATYSQGGAAPASGAVSPATPDAAQGLLVAQQEAAAAWQQLSTRLDPQWREYLAPAGDALAGTGANPAALQTMVERYRTVAGNPSYAPLTTLPEFQTAQGALQKLLEWQQRAATGQIQLPPPPAAPTRGF
jgi:lipid-binding SYLF domain-containing protein